MKFPGVGIGTQLFFNDHGSRFYGRVIELAGYGCYIVRAIYHQAVYITDDEIISLLRPEPARWSLASHRERWERLLLAIPGRSAP